MFPQIYFGIMLLLFMDRVMAKASLNQLYDVAVNQEGYFTAKQAKLAGFTDSTHPYHVKNGDWVREWRGIYRLNNFPQIGTRPELIMWQLWSRDRNEEPQGVFSHETALDIYNLGDEMPDKLHVTVPKSFRKTQETPRVLKLHFADLKQSDFLFKNGIRVTTILRTVGDLIEADTLTKQTLKAVLREAFRNGQILRSDIENINEEFPESVKSAIHALTRDLMK